MVKKTSDITRWLQTNAVRLTRVHFFYVGAYILSIVIFDTWNLYTHQAVTQLWTAGGVLLGVNIVLWYVARMNFSSYVVYKSIALALILADIAFAAFNIYWQHGLASKSVMLFTIPIVAAASLRSRSTVWATTTLCVATYSTVTVRYFFQNYGQGYRVELWGTVALYSAIFFVLAAILMTVIMPTEEKF